MPWTEELGKLQYMGSQRQTQLSMDANTQFSSVTQWCLTLCNPRDCSMPGLPVHHQLPEFNLTHVHWVGDAIQPSYPLPSPSLPAFNLSQHQGLFKWVRSLHQIAKVLEFQLQHQSFQWTPRMISFRMNWLALLAVQGTVVSLLQHHSSKASICLGDEQQSFCCFWDCIQVRHFGLFCGLWWLLHFF